MVKKQRTFRLSWLGTLPFFLPSVFMTYVFLNSLNPDSVWCRYRIYEQADGTYEVWWVSKSRSCELKGATKEEAKAFQVELCAKLKEFMERKPKGKVTR
jgi:hypothetical protein